MEAASAKPGDSCHLAGRVESGVDPRTWSQWLKNEIKASGFKGLHLAQKAKPRGDSSFSFFNTFLLENQKQGLFSSPVF